MGDSGISALRHDVSRAAAAFAIEMRDSYRRNLAMAMRLSIAAGLGREQVIALSVLPRDEAEALLDYRVTATSGTRKAPPKQGFPGGRAYGM